MDNKGNIRECGPRIKAAREYRNMTVQEIADKCAIDPKLFEEYEKGTYFPDIEFILSMSKFTNTSIKYLTCFSDDILEPSELFENGFETDTAKGEVFYYFSKFLEALLRLDKKDKEECLTKIIALTSDTDN